MEDHNVPPSWQCMLSRFSDQRQAFSAAEMSKSIHSVGLEFAWVTIAVAATVARLRGPRSGLRILLCPFPCCGNSLRLVLFPCLSYVVGKRIVWVRCAEQGLNREEDRPDLKSRRPVAWKGQNRWCAVRRVRCLLLRTSRQMRPSLSMLGW